MLGPDELSRFVADRFGREQIDLSHCVWRDDARPVHSTIVVDQSRKTRNVFASFEGAIGADPALPAAELINAAGRYWSIITVSQERSARRELRGRRESA